MQNTHQSLWIIGAIVMSGFVVLGSIVLTAMLAVIEIPKTNETMMVAMLGGFGPLSGVVVKYWLDNAARVWQMTVPPTTTTTVAAGVSTTETKPT